MCSDKTHISGPDEEPDPQWYQREVLGFRSIWLHYLAAIVLLLLSLAPLVVNVCFGSNVRDLANEHPLMLLTWVTIVALGYPLWAWGEAIVFESWVRKLPESQRKTERAYFTLQAGLAKNFWTAIVAIYTVASLIGIVLKDK